MKNKFLILIFLIFANTVFSQRWLRNFYSSIELANESILTNKNITKKLKQSFSLSSFEGKKALRYLDISPKNIERITKKFSMKELSEISDQVSGLSPRATKMFFDDLASYSNSDRIENLIAVLKKDKRILESYERTSNFLGVKYRTNVGVLLQIADGKSPIGIKTPISQNYKHLYKKKLISSNGLVFEGFFPVFENYTVFGLTLPKNLIKSSDNEQMKHCTNMLRKKLAQNPEIRKIFNDEQLDAINKGKRNIPGFTWHHSESKVGGMELVVADIHNKVSHDGGNVFWGGGNR